MLNGDKHVETVWEAISDSRMKPYLMISNDRAVALELYAWSARTSAAVFETLGHLEVLLRNALDACLREHRQEAERGIPWFMLPTAGADHVAEAVEVVRQRLRAQEQSAQGSTSRRAIRESRDQIVAGLSFGFWSGLLGPKYDELWRECLYRAFPQSSGRRKDVAVALERIRKLRNRLAHHDSMINVDVPFEVRQIIEVARYINPDVATWLEEQSRAMEIYAERPASLDDTVIVAARDAWNLYLDPDCSAYVCQASRAFRSVERIAFYADREVKQHIPKILHRRDNVEWTPEESARLGSGDRWDRKIAKVIMASRGAGWTDGRYQVFLLSRHGDPSHRELAAPLPHLTAGRGSAFTQRQRYVSLHALETAKATTDL
jgi:hypothetical protein